jgi:hypothetical protein
MSALTAVAFTSIAFAVILLLLFIYQAIGRRTRVTQQIEGDRAEDARTQGSIGDMAKLIEAFAKLADSLEKTGPLAMSMLGAMFFMVLALPDAVG